MDVNAVAALATTLKAVEAQNNVSMAVAKKVMDMVKTDGDLMVQMMQKAMGVGQNVNMLV
ncbi:MAG: putative motility protein [bacterium]